MTTVLAMTGTFLTLSGLLAWGLARWFQIQRHYDELDRRERLNGADTQL